MFKVTYWVERDPLTLSHLQTTYLTNRELEEFSKTHFEFDVETIRGDMIQSPYEEERQAPFEFSKSS